MTAVQDASRGVVYIDLDGPILDVAERHFRVHGSIVGPSGATVMTKAEYWELKRARTPPRALLARCGAAVTLEAYIRAWLDRIEAPEYLAADAVVSDAVVTLERLGARFDLILVTLRRHRAALEDQLRGLGLERLFADVLSGYDDAVPPWEVKRGLIERSGHAQRSRAFVGDTEADVLAGKALGMSAVALANGIRTRAYLAALEPDAVIPDVTFLPPLLERGMPEPAPAGRLQARAQSAQSARDG